MLDLSTLNLDQVKACSSPILRGFIRRCDRILDNETGHSADYRAAVAVFRSLMVGVLDEREVKK